MQQEVWILLLTGTIGLLAAVLVGVGEFLLHFSEDYSSKEPYQFMHTISQKRQSYGHFIAVLAAPLYLIGIWHIYKMLVPGNFYLAVMLCLIAGYGFAVGTVWIGSRALIGSIARWQKDHADKKNAIILINHYQLYSEKLLTVIRITTLIFSIGFVYLVVQGHTNYPRWMAIFNPFLILLIIFAIYWIKPSVGRYMMPIALNVTYTLFFILSIISIAITFNL